MSDSLTQKTARVVELIEEVERFERAAQDARHRLKIAATTHPTLRSRIFRVVQGRFSYKICCTSDDHVKYERDEVDEILAPAADEEKTDDR